MSQLYGRRVRATVNTLQVEDLRMKFEVKKTLTPEPNLLKIDIYNLSKTTRSGMQKRGVPVVVEAGYVDHSLGIIFSGTVRTVDHVRDGPDWITKVQAADGDKAFRDVRISKSYKAGTKLAAVIRDIAKGLTDSLDLGNLEKRVSQGGFRKGADQFVNGYVAHGLAIAELEKALDAAGLQWSIQSGKLQILGDDDVATSDIVSLDPQHGLIGSPEHGTPHKDKVTGVEGGKSVLKVKCLVEPRLYPGGKVHIECEGTKGDFRLSRVEHKGDTAGQDYYTEMECSPV